MELEDKAAGAANTRPRDEAFDPETFDHSTLAEGKILVTRPLTGTRDSRKRDRCEEEYLINREKFSTRTWEFDGKPIEDVALYAMTAAPFKYFTPSEQFMLAVERVTQSEIKSVISPSEPVTDAYPDPDAEVYDYSAALPMNDGDVDAFKKLRDAIGLGNVKSFHLREDMIDNIVDENLKYVMQKQPRRPRRKPDELDQPLGPKPAPIYDAIPEPTGKLSDDYVIGYISSNQMGTAVSINYDLYDPSHSNAYPLSTISVRASQQLDPTKDRSKLIWEYVFTIHCKENIRPRDPYIKAVYDRTRDYVRAIAAYSGIVPSNVQKQKTLKERLH